MLKTFCQTKRCGKRCTYEDLDEPHKESGACTKIFINTAEIGACEGMVQSAPVEFDGLFSTLAVIVEKFLTYIVTADDKVEI